MVIFILLLNSYVLIKEIPMVNFTCKTYFVDINFSSDSINTDKL